MHLQYRQTIRSFGVTVYVKLLGVITESDSILLDISLCFCFIENSLKTSHRCVHCVLFRFFIFRSTSPATFSSWLFCGDFSLTFLLLWCPPVLCGALCHVLFWKCLVLLPLSGWFSLKHQPSDKKNTFFQWCHLIGQQQSFEVNKFKDFLSDVKDLTLNRGTFAQCFGFFGLEFCLFHLCVFLLSLFLFYSQWWFGL